MNPIVRAWLGLSFLLLGFVGTESRAAVGALPEGAAWVRSVERDDADAVLSALRQGASPLQRLTGKTKERVFDRALTRGSEKVFRIFLRVLKQRGVHSRKLSDARGTPALLSLASLAVPSSPRAQAYERMAEAYLRAFPGALYERDQAYIGDGRLPIHGASAVGSVRLLRVFLDAGADPNVRNNTGETPLHLSARHGHIPVVQLLLHRGARINEKTRFTRATPLMYAAEVGRKPVIRELLMFGAMKSTRDVFGKTAKQRFREFSLNYAPQRAIRR